MTDEEKANEMIAHCNQHRELSTLVGGSKKGVFALADELVRVRSIAAKQTDMIFELREQLEEASTPWWRRLAKRFRR